MTSSFWQSVKEHSQYLPLMREVPSTSEAEGEKSLKNTLIAV